MNKNINNMFCNFIVFLKKNWLNIIPKKNIDIMQQLNYMIMYSLYFFTMSIILNKHNNLCFILIIVVLFVFQCHLFNNNFNFKNIYQNNNNDKQIHHNAEQLVINDNDKQIHHNAKQLNIDNIKTTIQNTFDQNIFF